MTSSLFAFQNVLHCFLAKDEWNVLLCLPHACSVLRKSWKIAVSHLASKPRDGAASLEPFQTRKKGFQGCSPQARTPRKMEPCEEQSSLLLQACSGSQSQREPGHQWCLTSARAAGRNRAVRAQRDPGKGPCSVLQRKAKKPAGDTCWPTMAGEKPSCLQLQGTGGHPRGAWATWKKGTGEPWPVQLDAAEEGKKHHRLLPTCTGENSFLISVLAAGKSLGVWARPASSMHRLVTSSRRFPSLALPQPGAVTTLLAQKPKCNQMYSIGRTEQCQETTMEITKTSKNKGEEVGWKGWLFSDLEHLNPCPKHSKANF